MYVVLNLSPLMEEEYCRRDMLLQSECNLIQDMHTVQVEG